jgi:hypothetical protein
MLYKWRGTSYLMRGTLPQDLLTYLFIYFCAYCSNISKYDKTLIAYLWMLIGLLSVDRYELKFESPPSKIHCGHRNHEKFKWALKYFG